MTRDVTPLNVAILALPETTASTLYGMFDLFASPGRDYQFITTGMSGEPRMLPYIVARDPAGFAAANGIWIKPHYGLSDCPFPAIVCIPDFFVNPGASVAGLHPVETAWLRQVHGAGAMLASACSGAVLLGEAGLLVDGDATIHWGYASTLSNNYPGVRVRLHQSLVLSGEGQRIVMAGGGSSWQDLALFLIARHVGLREAIEVAKVYMLQWHDLGQQPYAALLPRGKSGDAAIDRSQEWVARSYRTTAPVTSMVAVSELPARTFMRRFRDATGMTPLDFVHALRLEDAKQMLETGDLPIEAIAIEVGYEDAGFFGRLFRRKVGLTPTRYRLRFGSLRRALR